MLVVGWIWKMMLSIYDVPATIPNQVYHNSNQIFQGSICVVPAILTPIEVGLDNL